MRDAASVVKRLIGDRLIERSSVAYLFGPACPDGIVFENVKAVLDYLKQKLDLQTLDQALDANYAIVQRTASNKIIATSRKLPIQVTDDGAEKAAPALGLNRPDVLIYHMTSGDDRKGTLARPEEIFFRPKAGESAQKEAEDQKPRFTLDFTYSKKHSTKGVSVYAAHDGGPLALAGIGGGDVIVAARYSRQNQSQDVRIDNPDQLAYVLREMDDGTSIVLTVRRAASYLKFPVKPVPSNS